MSYNKKILNFWLEDDFRNITPESKQFPEGWDVRPYIRDIIKDEDVIEVGCGYGRLTEAFMKEQYLGVDINPKAIIAAKEKNPGYLFKDFDIDNIQIPSSTWQMFYTVLLHINDDDILPYLRAVTRNTNKVLVAEILGRKWRGWDYAFNRKESEYNKLFKECGFIKKARKDEIYEHYKNTRITFLVYERNNGQNNFLHKFKCYVKKYFSND